MFVDKNLREDKESYQKYREALVVLSLIPDTIESVYDYHLIYSAILNEEYSELKFDQNNFRASIIKVIHNCRKLNQTTYEDIINHLNSEFLKANITFAEDFSFRRPKYPKSGIVYGEGGDEIYLYVNKKFMNIIRSVNITTSDQTFNTLVEDLFQAYIHETTHEDQYNKQPVKQPGIDPDSLQTSAENLKYLSNPIEIDARARELATKLLLEGKTFEQVKEMFNAHKPMLKYEEYMSYWMRFGIYTKMTNRDMNRKRRQEKQKNIAIFNRFKRRVFDFILLDRKYVNKGNLIYTLNNKPE